MSKVSSIHVTHQAMGSPWEVDVFDCPDSEHGEIARLVRQYLDEFESTYSRFKSDSLIASFRNTSGIIEVPQTCMKMLNVCFDLYHATHGLFNPCIAQSLEDLGYDADYSLKRQTEVALPPLLDEVIKRVSDTEIELISPVALDFGAVGKGCAVDELVTLLHDRGLSQFVINGSGDMRHIGSDGIRVGLEHPEDPNKAIGICDLHNQAIACSGSNRRVWQNHHHIIDPKTLLSPDYIISTWVVTESALYADALATTLFLVPPEDLQQICSFEYVLVNKDMRVVYSQGWSGEVFS
jgi:FAD:protein FMN transferase